MYLFKAIFECFWHVYEINLLDITISEYILMNFNDRNHSFITEVCEHIILKKLVCLLNRYQIGDTLFTKLIKCSFALKYMYTFLWTQ